MSSYQLNAANIFSTYAYGTTNMIDRIYYSSSTLWFNFNIPLTATATISVSVYNSTDTSLYSSGVISAGSSSPVSVTVSMPQDKNVRIRAVHTYAVPYSTASVTINKTFLFTVDSISEGFTFFDNSSYSQIRVCNLPDASTMNNKMFFIKDKVWSASSHNLIVSTVAGQTIDGAESVTISQNGGCLILVSDGTNYWIANNYPSNRQPTLGTVASSSGWYSDFTASRDTINISSKTTQGTSANSSVNLPSPYSGAICIIVNANAYQGDGTYLIKGPLVNGYFADNHYDINVALKLNSNADIKCSGAVFISDGTTWYVAGWMYGDAWTWLLNRTSYDKTLRNNSSASLIIQTTQPFDYRELPSTSSSKLRIFKQNTATSFGYGTQRASAQNNPSDYTDTVFLNGTNSGRALAYNGVSSLYSCLWVAYNGRNVYPIIGYTPN